MKPGDLVLCIKQGLWHVSINGKTSSGPRCGEVLTVKNFGPANGWLMFDNHKGEYKTDRFIPLQGPVTCAERDNHVRNKTPVPV